MDPDLDGRTVQNLPVTVPGTVGHGATAQRVVAADLPKPLLAPLLEVAVLILHVPRRKLEFLDSINFNKSEVKLVVMVGVPDEKPQKVEPGAFPDEDEVGSPISQVCSRGEASVAPVTSAGHVRIVDGQELPADDLPLLHLLSVLQTVQGPLLLLLQLLLALPADGAPCPAWLHVPWRSHCVLGREEGHRSFVAVMRQEGLQP